MADETIIIQYVIQAEKAITDIVEMRKVITDLKTDMRTLVADGKVSFKEIERSMITSLRAMTQAADKEKLASFLKMDSPDALQGAKAFEAARKQAIAAVGEAVRQLAEEEKSSSQEAKRAVQDHYQEEMKLAREAASNVREMEAIKKAAQQEYITKSSQGWRTMSKEAEEYGRQIQDIKQKLYQFQQPMGSDLQGAGQQLIKKGANADDVTQALKEIAREEAALAKLRKKTLDEQTKAQQEYERITAQGFGKMSAAAKQYGQAVQAIKTIIQAQAQASGQTYQQVAKNLSDAGVGANVLKTALGEIKTAEAEAAKTAEAARQAEIKAMREYEQAVKKGYDQVMSPAAAAFGQQVTQVAQQIKAQSASTGQTYGQVAQQMQAAGTSANVLNSALKQLNTTANASRTAFQGLGNIVTNVFIIGLGVNVFNILRQLIAFFQQAAISGYELSKAFFQLEVGIRALRRAGVDIATQEMLDNLDQLSVKFGVFSKKDLVEGSAALVNLVRDMGFTKEQIFELQDSIATLAVVNGRAMDEVQRTVALALASGYTEGLQRLGVSINRVNIAARAASMGFAEGYMNLSEYERAAATLSLVLEKTALYQDDLIQYQKTLAGQYDTLIAKQKDQKALLGDELLPLQVEYNESLLEFYKTLTDILGTLSPVIDLFIVVKDALLSIQKLEFADDWGLVGRGLKTFADTVRFVVSPIQFLFTGLRGIKAGLESLQSVELSPWAKDLLNTFTELVDKIKLTFAPLVFVRSGLQGLIDKIKEFKDSIQDNAWVKSFQGALESVVATMDKIFVLKKKQIFPEEVPVGQPNLDTDKIQDAVETLQDNVSDLYEDIQKETRNFNNRMDELWRDLNRDLEKIDRDFVRDMMELWRDYQRDKAKIIEDGNRKAQKENEDYARDQGKVEQDYQDRVADENRDYQNDLIDAARDFQRKQDEAVRKYNLKQEEAERKYREDQIQAEIDYQERLRKLREGFLFDLEDALRERDARQVLNLTRRYNMEQSEAARNFQMEQEERARRYAAENEERRRQFEFENQERIRQFAEEQAEREREHQIRLADMVRERDQRLAEMALEHQQKLEQIKADTAAELEERRIQYEYEKEDRKRKAEEDKAERQLRYQQQLEELRISNQERLREIVAALAAEEGMTGQMLARIGQQYRAMYGPNGVIEGYIRYYISMLQALAQQQAAIRPPTSQVPVQYRNRIPQMARGGTLYADQATPVIFGEAGPEIAQFTPLKGSQRSSNGTISGKTQQPRKDKVSLLVSLSPDLVAEIQENTLDEVGSILMEVQRSTR